MGEWVTHHALSAGPQYRRPVCGWSFSQELHKFLIFLTTRNLDGWPNHPHKTICSTFGSQDFAFFEALHVLFQAYPGFLCKLDSVNRNIVFGKCYFCFQESTYIVRNWLIEEWSLKRIWHFDLWAIVQICSCNHAAPWTVLPLRQSVSHLFLQCSCYHNEIFRSNFHWQKWCPCKRSKFKVTEVKTNHVCPNFDICGQGVLQLLDPCLLVA